MEAPRSRRSKTLLGVGAVLVLANVLAPLWINEGSWEVAVLVCAWLVCLVAYLVSRAQDVRKTPAAVRDSRV